SLDFFSDQKPVVDGSSGRVFRDLIGAANGEDKGHFHCSPTIGELSIPQGPEKHVDHARIGLPDLVQVSHLCHRKFTFGDEYVFVFFERLDALNTEDVFVLGLICEKKAESFEIQSVAEHLRQVALGRSRRTEKEDMDSCRQTQENSPNSIVQFNEV